MASLRKVSIIAFFLLASGVLLSSTAQAFRANKQDFDLASEPSPNNGEDIIGEDLFHYVEECLKKLGQECGPKFFITIFIGEKSGISTSCCQRLVDMGKECHDIITSSVFSRPEFTDNETVYQKRSDDAWKMCSD